ncbi:phospholipid/cholesterol/gamma-HCH transport system substrate-binding protein [Chitinophaga ginsengisegetis]|uniref:Phospholipid/cholesterol/gamma-HCH transport system substrate-binding protein n=1 Tax=Chitinophaga ginsengisegetis TaxID=393003 RepID=A0A1T5P8Y6_9BACT|nr:MlaD family protein [Chitinophaga ginsengisegetis]MDR6570866.1 phospholipid/cholesterol/gamma-HCH transport system substrate-binding protein [Chitinophaga ginsengisegetis]MDR6650600.1 phospholipid/cholesterol/gamma-HCH transport system substrate-binding protein [Chitinophaga ginsengisegetis]MDR6656761.1 phospholipid/cholesterol/gamma-HCH transport system substrate-binding protein [Chitinophaga ginsengisegetis]SKD09181.1 phospholipid/cholesterol/gamma-HCH transport system substrate-binding pr
MEAGKKRAVIVGIFVFVGLVIFVTAIMMLGKQQKLFSKSIQVKAYFKDVNGLSAGRNILYSGVKIGTVKKISFVRTNQILVLMNIDESSQEFIHKDVEARISSEGLMGNKIVMLSGGTPNMPVIEDGDQLHVASGLSTEEIMSTLQVNNKSLVEITDNLKVITKRIVDGKGTLGRLLTEDTIYKDLNTTMAGLNDAVVNTRRLTGALSLYAAKLQTKGVLSNDLVTDTLVFAKLRTAVTEMNSAALNANQTVQELRQASAGLRANLDDPEAPVGMLLKDTLLADAFKETIYNLESGTQKLDTNMLALRNNFLFRGYFRKQAKRERKAQKEKEKAERQAQK